MKVSKYQVGFDGYVTVLATSYDQAKSTVEKDLKILHPKFNAKFSFISKMGEEE